MLLMILMCKFEKKTEMNYRHLGKAGLQVSELSYGSWLNFAKLGSNDSMEKCMKYAYDNGVNFFDNAEGYVYGKSEILMGKILQKMKWSRDTYVVSSKVFFGTGGKLPNQTGLSRKHVFEACDAALKRLKVSYLDLYFCHRPDPNTPVEETVFSMHQLFMQGKILYWGTSEWSAEQITEAHAIAKQNHLLAPTMEQPQYNVLHRERFEGEYQNLYSQFGMGTTIWSPLASGLLTGKYLKGVPKKSRLALKGLEWLREKTLGDTERLEKVKKLNQLAEKLGVPLGRLAIAWCLKNKNVSTVIIGASKLEQLKENLKSSDTVELLTNEVMNEIEKIVDNKPKIKN